MVEGRQKLEPEVQNIFNHIDSGKNFLLSGGAGSGKTYSLVQVICQVINEYPNEKIACITYTNAAVREIEDRVKNNNLIVSTIHDFIWDNIKSYQSELKNSLIALVKSKEIKSTENIDDNYNFSNNDIQYKDYTSIKNGIVSHDEVLILACYMFKTYSKLCDILKNKFKFIFIDEYQDTSPLVIDILLEHIQKSNRKNIIGFFGDQMQSIYDNGVGSINSFVEHGLVNEEIKTQNRRNPRMVYELANKFRLDNLIQTHSNDENAPNMSNGEIKNGKISFLYSIDQENLEAVKENLNWDFSDSRKTKILNLTHNLIATKAGFRGLMDIYDGDKILDFVKQVKKFINENNIPFEESLTFGQVLKKLEQDMPTGSWKATETMLGFINNHNSLYEESKLYSFHKISNMYIDKEGLIDDKKNDEGDKVNPLSQRDDLIKHLFKIQTNINLYNDRKFNDFLRKTEFKIQSVSDKVKLKEIIDNLIAMSNCTIENVIEFANKNGICKIDDKLLYFIEAKGYIYERVKQLKFAEFVNLYNYLEGNTPFSTQHKIKGAEFENVLVILDNGNWNKYNFKYLFENNGTESVRTRTNKLFYVCCTRAKENLAVYFHNPTQQTLTKAKSWFGVNNVFQIENKHIAPN